MSACDLCFGAVGDNSARCIAQRAQGRACNRCSTARTICRDSPGLRGWVATLGLIDRNSGMAIAVESVDGNAWYATTGAIDPTQPVCWHRPCIGDKAHHWFRVLAAGAAAEEDAAMLPPPAAAALACPDARDPRVVHATGAAQSQQLWTPHSWDLLWNLSPGGAAPAGQRGESRPLSERRCSAHALTHLPLLAQIRQSMPLWLTGRCKTTCMTKQRSCACSVHRASMPSLAAR